MNHFRSVSQVRSRAQFSLRTLLVLMTLVAAAVPFVVHWIQADRIPLQSSSIEAVTYQHFSGTLDVEFRNNATYRYFDVPMKTYRGLLDAESHGSYFFREIRNADFRFEKLE